MSARARKRQEDARRPDGEYGKQDGVNGASDVSLGRPVRYSFLEDWEARDEQFEHDYEGFPKRFFNADLSDSNGHKVHSQGSRLAMCTSTPSDNVAAFEDIEEAARIAGIAELKSLDSSTMSSAYGESWVGMRGDQQVIISRNKRGQVFGSYRFNRQPKDDNVQYRNFVYVDVRSLMGLSRIERRIGEDVAETQGGDSLSDAVIGDGSKRDWLRTLNTQVYARDRLKECQADGRSYWLTRKYVKERRGEIATAFSDKKNPDKLHQALMEETRLNESFSQVEIDNDVDENEWRDFENAYDEVIDKLPPIPGERQPKLRVRYLGKHRATGLYSPFHNTVAIDVRTSGSFVHEMGHYYDFAAYNNPSLSKDFSSMVGEYSKDLKMPEGASGKYSEDYYTTPTEVHSRMFEVYAHERLGINNRMLDTRKFENFDYAPIMNNPELKAKAFSFFDGMFGR